MFESMLCHIIWNRILFKPTFYENLSRSSLQPSLVQINAFCGKSCVSSSSLKSSSLISLAESRSSKVTSISIFLVMEFKFSSSSSLTSPQMDSLSDGIASAKVTKLENVQYLSEKYIYFTVHATWYS